ncbi:MAG: HEPN domain-containing protein, partial [Desulfobaccales bacterium]
MPRTARASRSIRVFIAFPTIFLYRNFIELCLKLIIRYGNQLYNIQGDYKQTHDLEKLWNDCRAIIENKGHKKETLDATENIIKEFSRIDSTSYETRYPEKKDRTFTMDGISNINLKNMKELMDKINNFLGSIGDGISCALSEE